MAKKTKFVSTTTIEKRFNVIRAILAVTISILFCFLLILISSDNALAETSLIHNPSLYECYLKKRNEGKAHRVALSHVAKKLVRIIFSLEKNNTDFDMTKMR